ncbi:glycosyltransferase [Sphingomonas sp. GCM10030256]|uniref:glycosyltransferase n=1 Tax=Sphingomonas sp. GCM10030256 TaxID=3273427 RepID=UPI003623D674
MATPLLSIVTVCFENPGELLRTLQSIARLPRAEFEAIVIDGSRDDSCKHVITSLSSLPRYVHERDRGMYDGMNKGIQAASGAAILFLNSGDELAQPDEFARAVYENRSLLGTHLLYGDTIDDFGTRQVLRHEDQVITDDSIRRGDLPCHQSILVPSSFCKRNPYDLAIGTSADTLFLRKAFKTLPQKKMSVPVSVFHYGGVSNTAPPWSGFFRSYREVLAARKLRFAERLHVFGQLLVRQILSSLLGSYKYRVLQSRRAQARSARQIATGS